MKNIKSVLARIANNGWSIKRKTIIRYLSSLSGSFLEVGPGEEPLLSYLKHVNNDEKIVIDIGDLSICRKLGYKCINQNAGTEKWDLPDNSMDVIVSDQCLEHIPNTDHFISEAHRILKQGGVLLLSVPNQGALVSIIMMLLTINPFMNEVSDKFRGLGNPLSTHRYKKRTNQKGYSHLRLFTIRSMNDLLKVYGFKVLKNHGGSWCIPLVGGFLAKIFPYYGIFVITLAKKI